MDLAGACFYFPVRAMDEGWAEFALGGVIDNSNYSCNPEVVHGKRGCYRRSSGL